LTPAEKTEFSGKAGASSTVRRQTAILSAHRPDLKNGLASRQKAKPAKTLRQPLASERQSTVG